MMRNRFFTLLLVSFLTFGWLLFNSTNSTFVLAQEATPTPAPAPTASPKVPSPHQTGDCLGCHSNPDMIGRFADGTTMSLYYDPKEHEGQIILMAAVHVMMLNTIIPTRIHRLTLVRCVIRRYWAEIARAN